MRIVILGSVGSWHTSELQSAAALRGHTCVSAPFEWLQATISPREVRVSCGELEFIPGDVVLVRMMPAGSLEQVVSRMDMLQILSVSGTLVVNSPRAVECAVDKGLTTMRLRAAGLPTPRTSICQTASEAQASFDQLGGDVVIKPLFGSEGRGIVRVSDPEICRRVCSALERIGSVIYMQEFIDHGGADLRLLVLGGQVLGAMRRQNTADFRTNIALQGVPAAHLPSEMETQLALRAAEAVGACFAGVDLMYDPRGEPCVIEVNAVPGWKALQQVSGIPVADRLLEFLESKLA